MQWDPPLFIRLTVLTALFVVAWLVAARAWEGLGRFTAFVYQMGADLAGIRASIAAMARSRTSRVPPPPAFVVPPPLPPRDPTFDATDWADDDQDTCLPDSKPIV